MNRIVRNSYAALLTGRRPQCVTAIPCQSMVRGSPDPSSMDPRIVGHVIRGYLWDRGEWGIGCRDGVQSGEKARKARNAHEGHNE